MDGLPCVRSKSTSRGRALRLLCGETIGSFLRCHLHEQMWQAQVGKEVNARTQKPRQLMPMHAIRSCVAPLPPHQDGDRFVDDGQRMGRVTLSPLTGSRNDFRSVALFPVQPFSFLPAFFSAPFLLPAWDRRDHIASSCPVLRLTYRAAPDPSSIFLFPTVKQGRKRATRDKSDRASRRHWWTCTPAHWC